MSKEYQHNTETSLLDLTLTARGHNKPTSILFPSKSAPNSEVKYTGYPVFFTTLVIILNTIIEQFIPTMSKTKLAKAV